MKKKKQNRDSGPWKKVSSVIGILMGVGILVLLVSRTGFSEISEAMVKGGPTLFLLVLLYPIELASRGYGWKFVYPDPRKIASRLFVIGIWFAQSINWLLPTATIGGVIVRGRFLKKRGGGQEASIITSLVADKTAHAVTTVVILFGGLFLLMTKPINSEIVIGILSVGVLLSVSTYLFIRLQRSSGASKVLERWSDGEEGFMSVANDKAREIEEQLDQIYRNPQRFIISVTIRLIGDIAMAAEVWFAAWLMNTPVSIMEALTLRLVAFGIRSVTFFIWGGLGVQEGTYALLSGFVGLSPASLVAISLATRVREIVTAIPGVAFWMADEGYRAVKMARSESYVEKK